MASHLLMKISHSDFIIKCRVENGVLHSGIRAGRSVRPVLSNVVYSSVRDKCVKHCRYLCFSGCLFAGVGLKLIGGEAVLLG